MDLYLDYSVLKEKLDALPPCGAKEFFAEVNPHLLDGFLLPILQGKSVSIGDLDFSQFDGTDVDDLRSAAAELDDALGNARRISDKILSNASTVKARVAFL